MENINHRPHRRQPKNDSGDDDEDKFSFPVFPLFEDDHHGCGSHDHPGLSPNSPADHLFFKGRLLPHSFPSYQPTYYHTNNYYTYLNFSRSTSITSSVSSKDSLLSSSSSRSNSINSRSSSCSTARTSTSTTDQASVLLSDRKYKLFMADRKRPKKPAVLMTTTSSSSLHYGSSRRWQFIMPAPPPTLKKHHHQQQGNKIKGGSRARKFLVVHHHHHDENGEREEELKKDKRLDSAGRWFVWRFFRSFVSACQECHAMNPSPRKYPTN